MENKIMIIIFIIFISSAFITGFFIGNDNFDDLPIFSVQISKDINFTDIVFNVSNLSWNDLLKEGIVNSQGLMRWDNSFWMNYVKEQGYLDEFNSGDDIYSRLWVGELN